jgi:hypothetical protein
MASTVVLAEEEEQEERNIPRTCSVLSRGIHGCSQSAEPDVWCWVLLVFFGVQRTSVFFLFFLLSWGREMEGGTADQVRVRAKERVCSWLERNQADLRWEGKVEGKLPG